MSRIYISGAITGTDDFMERFQKAEEKLKEAGHMVYNPARANSYMPDGTSYEEYMKVSFCLLDLADTIYMLEGWENSKGACRELEYAKEKDKAIIFEKENPFRDVNYDNMIAPSITIYNSPADHRGVYVARLFESAVPAPLNTFATSDSIEDLRDMIRAAGFNFCVPRDPHDHPVIVETWFR